MCLMVCRLTDHATRTLMSNFHVWVRKLTKEQGTQLGGLKKRQQQQGKMNFYRVLSTLMAVTQIR